MPYPHYLLLPIRDPPARGVTQRRCYPREPPEVWLRALHVMGHGSARISRGLGVREETIQRLVRGDARTIGPPLRDAIADLYDAWWDKRAPERTRAERAAAGRARRRAIAGNWCVGAALDDDQLDIPGYRPRTGHRPATGIGTALDVRMPVRRCRNKRRTTDDLMNLGLITGIWVLLDRHGYARGDDEHTGRAILLISDLAHIFPARIEGTVHACRRPSRRPVGLDGIVIAGPGG